VEEEEEEKGRQI